MQLVAQARVAPYSEASGGGVLRYLQLTAVAPSGHAESEPWAQVQAVLVANLPASAHAHTPQQAAAKAALAQLCAALWALGGGPLGPPPPSAPATAAATSASASARARGAARAPVHVVEPRPAASTPSGSVGSSPQGQVAGAGSSAAGGRGGMAEAAPLPLPATPPTSSTPSGSPQHAARPKPASSSAGSAAARPPLLHSIWINYHPHVGPAAPAPAHEKTEP
jgi:hypothetical protein